MHPIATAAAACGMLMLAEQIIQTYNIRYKKHRVWAATKTPAYKAEVTAVAVAMVVGFQADEKAASLGAV